MVDVSSSLDQSGLRQLTENEKNYVGRMQKSFRFAYRILFVFILAIELAACAGLVACIFSHSVPFPVCIVIVVGMALIAPLLFIVHSNTKTPKKPLAAVRINGVFRSEQIRTSKSSITILYLGNQQIDVPQHWRKLLTEGQEYVAEGVAGVLGDLTPEQMLSSADTRYCILRIGDTLSIDKEVPLGLLKIRFPVNLIIAGVLLPIVAIPYLSEKEDSAIGLRGTLNYFRNNYRQQENFGSVAEVISLHPPVNRTVRLSNVFVISDKTYSRTPVRAKYLEYIPSRELSGIIVDPDSSYKKEWGSLTDSIQIRLNLIGKFFRDKHGINNKEKDSISKYNPSFETIVSKYDPDFRRKHNGQWAFVSNADYKERLAEIDDDAIYKQCLHDEAKYVDRRISDFITRISSKGCIVAYHIDSRLPPLPCVNEAAADSFKTSAQRFAQETFKPRSVTGCARPPVPDRLDYRAQLDLGKRYSPRPIFISMSIFGVLFAVLLFWLIQGLFWVVRNRIIIQRLREVER
jgi:hypothetical protein